MKKLNTISIFSFFLFILLGLMSIPHLVKAQNNDHVPGQILVKFKSNTSQNVVDTEVRRNNARVVDKISALDTLVLKVPVSQEDKVVTALSKNPNVEYAELDYLAYAVGFPADPPNDTFYASNQWGLENTRQNIVGQIGTEDADIDAETAWKITTGDSVKVAVLDTGIDQDHPDLSSKIEPSLQKDFTGSGSVNDFYGHGTHVSGIVAAITNNTTGVAGVCPTCRLLNGKVLNDSGSGAYSWVAKGIEWAVQNNAKVINMSLGGSAPSKTLEGAVNYAWGKNVVLVGAAGNSGNQSKTYPGAYTNVIAVAATDNKDKKASFSEYGSWVDIAAPGVNIYSTFPTHPFYLQTEYGRSENYDFGSGTSMATPMVSGTVALIWSTVSDGTSASQVRTRLESTADKITGTGTYWSAGRVNAANAVGGYIVPSPIPILSPTPTSITTPTPTPTPTPKHGRKK